MTDKEKIIFQGKIDTLKQIKLGLLINLHSSKLVLPPKLLFNKTIYKLSYKYIMWRANRDFKAVQNRIKLMEYEQD